MPYKQQGLSLTKPLVNAKAETKVRTDRGATLGGTSEMEQEGSSGRYKWVQKVTGRHMVSILIVTSLCMTL